MRMEFRGSSWQMADAFWRQFEPLLPKYATSPRGGRPRANLRQVMDGIFYVLRTGCQWKALPREYGSGSTVHRYFQEWTQQGVFGKAWRRMLQPLRPSARYRLELAERRWLHDQGAAGRGKKPAKTRPIAVSWASSGRFFPTAAACRSVWRSAAPTPTTRDFSFETLDSLPLHRPQQSGRRQHLCLDKGYDCEAIRQRLRRRGYVPHISSRGEEQSEKRMRGKRARRWVVERVASWLNRYRRILVRWEKKADNYRALLHFVFAHILWRNS